MRLIDADNLLDSLYMIRGQFVLKRNAIGVSAISDAIIKLNSADTIEAEPVRHGKWIADTAFGNDIMSGGGMVVCSACGMGFILDGAKNYCPNCGARMNA